MGIVKCTECKYVCKDEKISTKKWTAYECRNPKSDYTGALLNVNEHGARFVELYWPGCEWGVKKEEEEDHPTSKDSGFTVLLNRLAKSKKGVGGID